MLLLNVFLKSMSKLSSAGMINVLNNKNDDLDELRNWDILYYSTSQFTSRFTESIHLNYPEINSINVVTDYHRLKTPEDKDNLCAHTFNNLGIKTKITV